jgi:chromosome segregation ATPase
MDPQQIVAQANRETERLTTENSLLRSSVATLEAVVESYKSMVQDQTIITLNSQAETRAALAQRDLLGQQVSYIERFSDGGAAASAASIGVLEERLREAEATGHSWSQYAGGLSAETTRLQAQVAELSQQSSEEKEKIKENGEKICQLTAEVLISTIRRNESDKILRGIDGELGELTKNLNKLVDVRNGLESRLAASDKELEKISKKNKKAIQKATKEKEKLSKELEEAEARVQENDKLREDLRAKAEIERQLQEKLQNSLDNAETLSSSVRFYRAANKKQMETISSYKKRLLKLEDEKRAAGFGKAIREKEVEVKKLTEQVKRLNTQMEQKQRLLNLTLLKAKESAAIAKQKEQEATGWALTSAFQKFDTFKIERFEFGKEIVNAVFNALRGINSTKKAQEAVTTIHRLLAMVEFHIRHYRKDMEATIKDIHGLTKNIKELVEKAKEPQDFTKLIDDVRALQLRLKNSIKRKKDKGKKVAS